MAELTKIRLSGQTYDIVDESALHTLDASVTSGSTNAVAGGGVYDAIEAALQSVADQHYQTSGDVQNAISGKADTTAVTQSINEAVSGKANTSDVVTAVDFDYNNGETGLFIKETKNGQTTQKGGFFVKSGLTLSTVGQQKHIAVDFNTVAQKTDIPSVSGYADSVKYNSTSKYVEFYHGGTGGTKVFEYDASPFLIDGMVSNVEIKDVPLTEEATLTTTVTSYTFNSGATSEAIVKVTDGWWTDSEWKTTFLAFGGGSGNDCILAQNNGSIYCDDGTATNTGNTIHIQANNAFTNVYYQGITNLSYFESISAVYGSQTCLVISFNTDAGKQDINIPISTIFDASNYYTKSEVDTALAAKANTATTYTKTETDNAIDAATSGKVDTTTFNTYSGNVETALSGKQDTLVNQTNIKSINGESLLGSGNITIEQGTVDQTVISGSTNAVAGGAVYDELQGKQATLVSGTNIKTVGGNSLLGSGNIAFPEGMTARVGTGADAETLIFEFN